MEQKYTETKVLNILTSKETVEETPLEMPVMNFGKKNIDDTLENSSQNDDEKPLTMPVMKF